MDDKNMIQQFLLLYDPINSWVFIKKKPPKTLTQKYTCITILFQLYFQ